MEQAKVNDIISLVTKVNLHMRELNVSAETKNETLDMMLKEWTDNTSGLTSLPRSPHPET